MNKSMQKSVMLKEIERLKAVASSHPSIAVRVQHIYYYQFRGVVNLAVGLGIISRDESDVLSEDFDRFLDGLKDLAEEK